MTQKFYRLLFKAFFLLIISCTQEKGINVGDIPFDKEIDDINFKVCNEHNIKQYYVRKSSDIAPNYKGEKRALEKIIHSQYKFPKSEKENGYVTIRFIVNCEGVSGRFRIEEMDFSFKPRTFDKKISTQLVEIIKELDGWTPRKNKVKNFDFYKYLTFKLKSGQIIEILP